MIRQFINYLFPPPRLVDALPLLPTKPADPNAPVSAEAEQWKIDYLKAYAVVRSDAEAANLITRYPDDTDIAVIAARHMRLHRETDKWRKAWKRFRALF